MPRESVELLLTSGDFSKALDALVESFREVWPISDMEVVRDLLSKAASVADTAMKE